MSEALTDGFVPSEINDHKPESSINRILDEARIDSEQFCNYLKAAFSEAPQDILDQLASTMVEVGDDNLEQALASVLEITRKGLFVQLSDALFILKWKIDEFPEQYRESARTLAELENDATSLQNPLWHAYMPSHQAELIAEHIWPNDPERFFQFAKKYAKASDFMWKVVFRLYEDLIDKKDSDSIDQLFDASPLIWNTWRNLQNDEESYASYKKRMAISIKWHKRLVKLGLLSLAKEFEKSCPHPRGTGSEIFEFHREKKNLMEWERLSCTVPLQTDEEKKRCIELSFLTGNSFLETDCSRKVITKLINASVEVNCWEEGEYQVEDHMGLKKGLFFNSIHLHELWYTSDHREKWLSVIEQHLDEVDVSRQLLILNHTLKAESWALGNSDDCPENGYHEWREALLRTKVEEGHWNAWHKRLMVIGGSFLKGEIWLSYEDLTHWIKIVIDHGYRGGVERKELVPYADKALAFLRPYLNISPEGFKVESCEMAYRILLTYAPDKLIRNLLPMIVKAEESCCGNKLEYGAGSSLHLAENYDYPLLWWFSVMISNALRVSLAWEKRSEYISENGVRIALTADEIDGVNLSLRKTFAEFCLKNLALKKGKSCKEARYSNKDCVEERPLWRQAFAQALTEIGLDLGGDVHKRLSFVKKSDPDESVRKAAAKAYTSVRHQEHHNDDDPVKGMLISFWWLRLAQRKSLGLQVDPSEATKTRRNELRYASQVREVVYEIQQIETQII